MDGWMDGWIGSSLLDGWEVLADTTHPNVKIYKGSCHDINDQIRIHRFALNKFYSPMPLAQVEDLLQ